MKTHFLPKATTKRSTVWSDTVNWCLKVITKHTKNVSGKRTIVINIKKNKILLCKSHL